MSGPTVSRTTGIKSKRLAGRLCSYCPSPAATWDHVFAKKFFLPTRRGGSPILPQVPACNHCNNGNKKDLEDYLMTVLPFGAQHVDSLNNLQELVPPRLKGNKKLHQSLAAGSSQVWTLTRFGYAPTMTLSVEWKKLIELFRYIVRGLMVSHWGVRLTDEHFWYVAPLGLVSDFDRVLNDWMRRRAKGDPVRCNLGDGTFLYEGVQATDNNTLSAWRFSIYGGLKVADDTGETTLQLGALTGPRRMFDKAYPPIGWLHEPQQQVP